MQIRRLWQTAIELRRWVETDSPRPETRFCPHWLILVVSVAGSAWAAVRLGQDVSWDVQNYHYYIGWAFLHKPRFYDFAPAQVQSFFNPLLHVLSYLLLAHFPARAAAAVLGAVQGLNLYLLFQISQTLFRRWRAPYRYLISAGNALAGFYGAINAMELGGTFGDNMVSILTLAGLLLGFRYLMALPEAGRRAQLPLWIGGAAIGVAWALKLTAIIYAAGIVAAMTVVLLPATRRLRPLAALYGGMAGGFLAAYGFWGLDLVRRYHNPVYPYLNSIFRSSYYDLHNTMDARFMPRDWQEMLFYPFYFIRENHLVSEVVFRDARLACCYAALALLAIFALIARIRRYARKQAPAPVRGESRCLLALSLFFVIAYAAWQYIFSVYRYLAVLELLAPTLLALSLAWLLRNKTLVLGASLAAGLGVSLTVVPMNYGRQAFDDGFLRVEAPAIPDLDRSVVLMVGEEGTAYILPHFPPTTRFVRVFSNFVWPGRNERLDREIRGILGRYDLARTLAYLANTEEAVSARSTLAYFGLTLDGRPCWEIRGKPGNRGYLCGVATAAKPAPAAPPAPEPARAEPAKVEPPKPEPPRDPPAPVAPGQVVIPVSEPQFQVLETVRLEIIPAEAVAGRDTLEYRVTGMNARAIDVLYTLDGNPMPPVRNWALDSRQTVSIHLGPESRKGLYHIIGIRNSDAPDRNLWIRVDALVTIR